VIREEEMLIDAAKAFLMVVDVQERLLSAIAHKTAVEGNSAILLQAARQMQVPAVVSRQYPKGLGPTVASLAQFVPENSTFDKVEFSCARDPVLMDHIDGLGRRQAVLCGVEAHICVLQTALDLKERGYEVFVAVDAIGSRADLSRDVARERMAAAGAILVTSEMVVFEMMRTAASPQFKILSKLIQ
jgi:nicotinamidase-related amidase